MAMTNTLPASTTSAPRSPLMLLAEELWRDKAGFIGFVVIVALVAMAICAPLLAPYDPAAQDIVMRLQPPAWMGGDWAHPLGTDQLGRDILSRVIFGARASLTVGVCVVACAGTFGVLLGLLAGFVGGRVDLFIMRAVDVQVAFPGLLLIILVVSVVGPGLITTIVVLALTNWMVYARVIRGIVMSVRHTAYVEAAEMIGCAPGRIIFRHILPNLTSPLLTLGILEFTNVVLAEAAMSFLGLGIQPPATSWGLDVANGKDYLFVAWWLVAFPGLSISITVLAINLFANWLRVTTDPQEREKRFARAKAAERRHDRKRGGRS